MPSLKCYAIYWVRNKSLPKRPVIQSLLQTLAITYTMEEAIAYTDPGSDWRVYSKKEISARMYDHLKHLLSDIS